MEVGGSMICIIWIVKQLGNLIYSLFKLLPTMNKVVLITRRSKKTSIDFMMLKNKINATYPSTKVVILNHKLRFKIMLPLHVVVEMYHLATSKSAIIDSYVIPVSIYKHKKNLKIIQIWHALGAIKKFGYAVLDKNEGNKNKLANFMKMHKNYDYIICGSNAMIDIYSRCFNSDKNKIKPYGMPRVDYLLSVDKERVKEEVYKYYGIDKEKKTILYAPTFRKKKQIPYEKIIEQVDFNKYNLIIKKHHLDKSVIIGYKNVIVDKKFDVMDLAIASDYIITDYSAVTFEAAILEKPIFFYVYDIKKYKNNRGLFINYDQKTMPGVISSDAWEIIKAIECNMYDLEMVRKFKNKYVTNQNKNSTDLIIGLINLGEVYEKEYSNIDEKVVDFSLFN